jgi:hypothetical protein
MDFTTTPRSPAPLHLRLASWPSCWMQQGSMTMSNDGLIAEVAMRMDADEIVEVLDLDPDVLIEALRDHIIDNREKFNEYLEVNE